LTGSSVSGFDPADFSVDASAFANEIHGAFSVSQVGNALVLNYSAVPEASTTALAALGFAAAVLSRRRRRAAA
jgi:MYXO-CTERM domain-containing protein